MKQDKQRILITGVSGLLGNNLAVHFRDRYEVLGVYATHPVSIDGVSAQRVDLAQSPAVKRLIENFQPQIVIHCAALTSLEACEIQPELTRKANILATRNIARSLPSSARMVYISTDAVYDGKKGYFRESDSVGPLSVYARSKRQGEIEALKRKNTLVARTSIFGWNIQPNKLCFPEEIIRKLSSGQEIPGIMDIHTSMIYTFQLAELLERALGKKLHGIYNFACRDSVSKYEFAIRLAKRLNLDTALVKPVKADDIREKLRAPRSRNLQLVTEKLEQALGTKMPTIQVSIDRFVKDYKRGLPQAIRPPQSYPAWDYIPYGRQTIDEDDIAAVVTVLKSRNLTQGPQVHKFEETLCRITGARFCVAVNSATSALHLACLAAGVEPGKEAVTSPNTFVASANSIVYCGGTPVFADIEEDTHNLALEEVEKKINVRTQAVIPVHFAGRSCEMEQLKTLVEKAERRLGHRIYIIEDASHALGSRYQGGPVGNCRFSDMAVMSFHPVKHVTTGEGGIVTTNDENLYKTLKRLRSHGITSTPEEFAYPDEGRETVGQRILLSPWYYEQQWLGFNYRITDIQCALGISQLNKLPAFIERRKEIFSRYQRAFRNIPHLITPLDRSGGESNFHLYVLQIDFESLGRSRTEFMLGLKEKGIVTQVHYIPVYRQPFYRQKYNIPFEQYPRTEKYYRQCLSIPLFPAMTDQDTRKVIAEVKNQMGKKT